MRRSGLIRSRQFIIGILVWTAVLITDSEALRGSAVVLQAKAKIAEQKAETDDENNNSPAANVTKSQLTGIPQIDYILDPNLPRELNGHNLTDYPFYNSIPEEIDFKCDGLHDGFYASVPHKCQVYHHCLFGTRYDFLCANYTAFDQKTFICHFVSEVDCDNSPKYYKRNEALYKVATTASTTTTTTTQAPSTTSTTAAPPQANNGGGSRHGGPARRRRPYRRRRPMYEYYYDEDEYADSDYYDEDAGSLSHRRIPYRKHNKDHYANDNHDLEGDYDSHTEQIKPATRAPGNGGGGGSAASSSSVYDRPRAPPKIRRPVPKSERDKYDYAPKQSTSGSSTSTTTTTTEKLTTGALSKNAKQPADDEYYDDDEEYDYEEPSPAPPPPPPPPLPPSSPKSTKSKHHMDYDFPSGYEETRRYTNRYRNRMPSRKRAEMYDDYDTKERAPPSPPPARINRRKEYSGRYDNERPRNIRPQSYRNKNMRHEEYTQSGSGYKKRPTTSTDGEYGNAGGRAGGGGGRRVQEQPKRIPMYDDYYYDEEEEREEVPPKRSRRPQKTKAANSPAKPTPATTAAAPLQAKYEDLPPEHDEKEELLEYANKYNKGYVNSPQRNAKANGLLDGETAKSTSSNEISTTENVAPESAYTTSSQQNQKHSQQLPHHHHHHHQQQQQQQHQQHIVKNVKIINNSLKEESDESVDSDPAAESRPSSATQTRPTLTEIGNAAAPKYGNSAASPAAASSKALTSQSQKPPPEYYATAPEMVVVRKEKKPSAPENVADGGGGGGGGGGRPFNKTITPVRHFVITTPVRKPIPSHYGSPSTTTVNNYRETIMPYKSNEKTQKLPEAAPNRPPDNKANEYYKPLQQYVKLPNAYHQNSSGGALSEYAGVHFRNFIIPIGNEPPQTFKLANVNLKPAKEEHLIAENLNTIANYHNNNNNNNNNNNAFMPESAKPFVDSPQKPAAPQQQPIPPPYQQEHRIFNTGSGKLFTTNSIAFPQQPPSNYDITAPGPSAPAEESLGAASDKKYSSDQRQQAQHQQTAYNTNADYDVTYNDALQPSTLHSIRRYPSTSFFLQNQPPQPQPQPHRTVLQSRLPSEYAFNESAFNSLSRSQNHY